ncbi:amylo-alpha-1,6-glucosidase [Cyclobacterium amurskyense]|uniref:Glycogen debranching enzyme n=1 Tax=Cyclobacterium amurskyense TaxID=320787 RepID=A0A0H4PQ45_9BACT|nr:amylo-alpha-1,6-glucosidase [Cyclobacterium amurskyense]AKP50387.1 Glycogen debranching enzyme [Cyclobacterium amurskyense]|tara:strand:+ start:5763 stop:7679 length:1917 start_codon:yes stop_codon:yes gene_type:complete
MSYIHFDKTQLINLNYSLDKEIIRSNPLGCYTSTTIIGCNTRKYHGLLVAPQPQIDGQLHVLLSNVHETIVQKDAVFNLGINKYPGTYSPRGHKYLEDFDSEPIPKLTYRVGGVILDKEIILDSTEDRVMIRYTMVEAIIPTKLRINPFLAFRGYHALSKANTYVNKKIKKIDNGVQVQLYDAYDPLSLQVSIGNDFVPVPNWFYNIEYIREIERGYDYQEDLYVPGYFEFDMKKGDSVVFSAGLKVADTGKLHTKFNEEIKRRIPRDNFENCLKNSAGQFISRRDGETRVIAGYPWFGWWGRDTFIALPGLTLTMGDNQTFLDVMDSMSKDLKGAMFPNVGSGVLTNMNSIDAPLWFFWSLQQYIIFTGDKETIQSKYIDKCKGIIDGFIKGTEFKIHVKENGLISGGIEGVGLTWMDAVTKDGPVTPRIGCPVEINALWYNALCFYHEMTGDESIRELADKVAVSFVEGFWSEKKGYLADVIDGEEKDWSIRPNMVFATSLPYSPLSDEHKDKVLEIVKTNLFTHRGLRTLAPSDPRYKGYYKGDQYERDNAYHQGTAWPWLLGHFAEGYLKLHGKQGKKLVENMISSFDEVMTQYGIGTIAEIYEGDPPHRPKGAISQAWSVGELLRMKYLINNL